MLSQQWWVGLGVIVATVVAVVGYLLASGGSSSSTEINTVHGYCSAAGNNNTLNCPRPSSGTTTP